MMNDKDRRRSQPDRDDYGDGFDGFTSSTSKKWWQLPNFKDPTDRRRSLLWSTAVGLLIVVCLLPSLSFAGAFALYKHASSLATEGVARLEQGGTLMKKLSSGSVDAATTSAALQDFQAAYTDFSQLQGMVGLIGFAGGVPKYGSEISSAQQLLPIAVEASQMAVLGTSALNLLLQGISNPFAKTGGGLTTGNMQTIDSDFQQVVALFNTLAAQIQQLNPASLTQFNAKLGADIIKVKAELPKAQPYIQLATTVLGLLPGLLGVGTPANYLIEVLDSTELRPGGGFFGNYGVLTLVGGREHGLHITDIDLIDRDRGGNAFNPLAFSSLPQYQWFATAEEQQYLGMRDSNLEADFQWDAQTAESLYFQEAPISYQYWLQQHQLYPKQYPTAQPQPVTPAQGFQGVMAITPGLIQGLLGITGNITVTAPAGVIPPSIPGANAKTVTVTPTTMIPLIHYFQLAKGHGSEYEIPPGSTTSARKAFTASLFTQLMARVVAMDSAKRAKVVKLALDSLKTKDLQVYLGSATTPSPGEALLQKFDVASDIQAPKTGDSLFVVDANVTGNKQNEFIYYSATDNITINAAGDAMHTLTLTYKWPTSLLSSANNYGDPNEYLDHIRIYVPPTGQYQSTGSTVLAGYGGTWQLALYGLDTGNQWDFNRGMFIGDLHLYYPSELAITLSWIVPGAAIHSGQNWTYQLLYQHQAGLRWTQTTTITLPACAKVTSLTKLKPGKSNSALATEVVTGPLPLPLNEDTTYAVHYTCAS